MVAPSFLLAVQPTSLGQLSINGGTVTMSAAKTSAYADTNYNGILFYMDYRYADTHQFLR